MAPKKKEKSENLEQYRHKRDFGRTPEPEGQKIGSESGDMYLIQKHAARNLHYDLRLELDGVLKSWAVPKGPSLVPGEKRLAVHVEDHPVEYGAFEGIIPEGEYGGGAVMLWDRGSWEAEADPRTGYRKGRLNFSLHGEKLQGNWTLARMGGSAGAGGKNWLLIKREDDVARGPDDPDILEKESKSVLSGRSIGEIAEDRDRIWRDGEAVSSDSDRRGAASEKKKQQGESVDPSALKGAKKTKMAEKYNPQLAVLVSEVPEGEEWVHEIKFDGYRMLCLRKGKDARLISRNEKDWTDRFPEIVEAAVRLPLDHAVLDGEIVVLDPEGISAFQALQNRMRGLKGGQLAYYLFDILYCGEYDLTGSALIDRKEFLRRLLGKSPPSPLRYSDHIRGQGQSVYQHACRFALEGVISKRTGSPYKQKRSPSWLKVKCLLRQEFVIGGYSEPSGSRTGFGALLLGYFQSPEKLKYAGRVGTGFDEQLLRELAERLSKTTQPSPPFDDPPRDRGVHWVRPELVAEVEFTEWTSDGRLRHPSFKGLREDKEAAEIARENPLPLEKTKGGGKKNTKDAPKKSDATVDEREIKVAGVRLSNPERVMYPEQGATKESVARYYEGAAEWILPHIANRPLTLVRCPQGHHQKCFYQKHFNDTLPEAVRCIPIQEKEGKGTYIVIDDAPGLISLVQIGVLELHPWGSREDKTEHPDRMIFDLDPGPDVEWDEVLQGARMLRDFLEWLGLRSFVKLSGGKGLHVVVPLVRRSDWDEVKIFSRRVAETLARSEPDRFIATMSKAKRQGKTYIDYLRNSRGATSIAAYSTRARVGAPVAAPLRWDELTSHRPPDHYNIQNMLQRLARLKGDPWEGFFSVRQSLSKTSRKKLGI